MKIFAILCLFLFLQCSLKEKNGPKELNVADSNISTVKKMPHKLKNFLSLNCLASYSLAIDKDTIDFIEYSTFHNEKDHYSRKYWFDLNYYSDTSRYRYFKISDNNFPSYFTYLKQKPIFIEHIGTPHVEYSKIPKEIGERIKSDGIDPNYVKTQKFNDKYFFLDHENTLRISIYDPTSDLLEHLNIRDDYFTITDFFIFDLEGDGKPEIFVFSRDRRPSNDEVGFDVYSIGQ